MRLAFKISIFIVFISLENSIYGARTILEKRNQIRQKSEKLLERNKRWLLVFPPNGGTAKYVAGYLGPIDTRKYINCNAIRNFQYQYDLPNNLSMVYQKYSSWTKQESYSRNLKSKNNNDEYHLSFKPDSSRKIAYEMIEEILTKEGKNGRECLLRTICEVAETSLRHNGLVGELLEIFFTPGRYEIIHNDYHDARKAGQNHIDCVQMYPDCPFGDGILDTFSIIKDYKFADILYYW